MDEERIFSIEFDEIPINRETTGNHRVDTEHGQLLLRRRRLPLFDT